jgi:putative peptidoglycan lipid II flippase
VKTVSLEKNLKNQFPGHAKLRQQWNRWTNASTNRKILGAAAIIASLTLIVKLASLTKEIVVAGSFGTADALDAFLMASLLPTSATIIIGSTVKAALIPTYVRVREQEGNEPAQRLFSSIMVLSIALLTLAAFIMVFASPFYLPIIASGFSDEKIKLTRGLLQLLSPVIVIFGLNAVWGALLNADRSFGLVAITPVVTPLMMILFLVFGGSTWGIRSLAIGTVCGMFLEASIIGAALKRRGISLLPKWYGLDENVRQVIRQLAPLISGAILMCGMDFADQAMAAMLGPGSVSALNYGKRIISVPLSLSAIALGTAVIPYFSSMVARQDWPAVRHTLKRLYFLIFMVSVPGTLILIKFSAPVVSLLYQRGSFSVSDTLQVASIQSLYALQIPFYIAGIVVLRLLSSMQANKIFLTGNMINLVVCISLNVIFIKWLGIAGIALSTSCVYLISFIYLHFSWRRISRGT